MADDIVDRIDKKIYGEDQDFDIVEFCILLEDAANEIRKLRGQSEKPKQYS